MTLRAGCAQVPARWLSRHWGVTPVPPPAGHGTPRGTGRAPRTHQSMMLVDKAAENPKKLKLISVAVHSARPPMTGMSERLTSSPAERQHTGAALQCLAVGRATPHLAPGVLCTLTLFESSRWRENIAHASRHPLQSQAPGTRQPEPPAPRPAPCTPPPDPKASSAKRVG